MTFIDLLILRMSPLSKLIELRYSCRVEVFCSGSLLLFSKEVYYEAKKLLK